MVAARRAAARIVDTLTAADRFAVLAFDDRVEHPTTSATGLVAGDRPAPVPGRGAPAPACDARGGTELLAPLTEATGALLAADGAATGCWCWSPTARSATRTRSCAASTAALAASGCTRSASTRRSTPASSAGWPRPAAGRCELVESEDRLDEAMDRIHRRIGAPVVTGLSH